MTDPLYLLACVAVPCGIGLVMYEAFELWHRCREKSGRTLPFIDYWI